MDLVYIVLFFVVYHFVLYFLFQQVNDTKTMDYLKTRMAFSVIFFGILIPIFLLLLIYKFDSYRNLGFIVAISFIYAKFFFNYKIFKSNN